MELHKDEVLYQELVPAAASEFGIPESYVEKDYFVSLLLKNLSHFEPNILLKGGTSLSKCFTVIHRFSEDIDLNLITEGKPTNRDKKYLKSNIMTTIEYCGMHLANPENIFSRRDYNKYSVAFPKAFDSADPLKTNIEIETFLALRSFPYEKREATNYIYEFLKNQDDLHLIEKYSLVPFQINTQSIARTFIDKILAICDYHENETYTQYSRHIYDIHKIWQQQEFKDSDIVRVFYDVVEERRKRPKTNHSVAKGYRLFDTLKKIINNDDFKEDYNSNTVYLIQDEVTYEETKKSISEIMEKGMSKDY